MFFFLFGPTMSTYIHPHRHNSLIMLLASKIKPEFEALSKMVTAASTSASTSAPSETLLPMFSDTFNRLVLSSPSADAAADTAAAADMDPFLHDPDTSVWNDVMDSWCQNFGKNATALGPYRLMMWWLWFKLLSACPPAYQRHHLRLARRLISSEAMVGLLGGDLSRRLETKCTSAWGMELTSRLWSDIVGTAVWSAVFTNTRAPHLCLRMALTQIPETLAAQVLRMQGKIILCDPVNYPPGFLMLLLKEREAMYGHPGELVLAAFAELDIPLS